MKKYFILLVASLLFVGCGHKNDKFATPKFPENALVYAYANPEFGYANTNFLEIVNLFTEQSMKKYEAMGVDVSELVDYSKKTDSANRSILWTALCVEAFDIPSGNEEFFRLPAITYTISSKTPINVDECIKGVEYTINTVMETIGRGQISIKYTKTNEDGFDIWRIEVDDEIKSKCLDFAPVLSTANDGKVLFVASSDVAYKRLRGLYDGTIKSLPNTQDTDNLFKLATNNLRAFLDSNPNKPIDNLELYDAIEDVSLTQTLTNDCTTIRLALKMNNEDVVNKQLNMGWQAKGFISATLPIVVIQYPEISPVVELYNGITLANENSSLVINIPMPFATIKKIDFQRLLELTQTSRKQSTDAGDVIQP